MNLNTYRNAERPQKVLQQRLNRLRQRKNQYRLLRSLAATVLLTYIFFGIVFGIGFVHGRSMAPSFQDGDLVILWRLSKNYSYGDVVLFKSEAEKELMKRVVAVPGDTVDVDTQNRLIIRGQIIQNVYAKPEIEYPITLKENEYFVLGDNWQAALDSRNFGAVEKRNIQGRVICVLLSHIRECVYQ